MCPAGTGPQIVLTLKGSLQGLLMILMPWKIMEGWFDAFVTCWRDGFCMTFGDAPRCWLRPEKGIRPASGIVEALDQV